MCTKKRFAPQRFRVIQSFFWELILRRIRSKPRSPRVAALAVTRRMRPLPFYAEVFDEEGALDKLEGFASHFGPDFYGKARNSEQVTLVKEDNPSPLSLSFGDSTVATASGG
jgi:dihydroorotase